MSFQKQMAEKREWNSHKKIEQTTRDMVKYLQSAMFGLGQLFNLLP